MKMKKLALFIKNYHMYLCGKCGCLWKTPYCYNCDRPINN